MTQLSREVIEFRCGGCGVNLRVSVDKEGRSIKCPKCSRVICTPAVPRKKWIAGTRAPDGRIAADLPWPTEQEPARITASALVDAGSEQFVSLMSRILRDGEEVLAVSQTKGPDFCFLTADALNSALQSAPDTPSLKRVGMGLLKGLSGWFLGMMSLLVLAAIASFIVPSTLREKEMALIFVIAFLCGTGFFLVWLAKEGFKVNVIVLTNGSMIFLKGAMRLRGTCLTGAIVVSVEDVIATDNVLSSIVVKMVSLMIRQHPDANAFAHHFGSNSVFRRFAERHLKGIIDVS